MPPSSSVEISSDVSSSQVKTSFQTPLFSDSSTITSDVASSSQTMSSLQTSDFSQSSVTASDIGSSSQVSASFQASVVGGSSIAISDIFSSSQSSASAQMSESSEIGSTTTIDNISSLSQISTTLVSIQTSTPGDIGSTTTIDNIPSATQVSTFIQTTPSEISSTMDTISSLAEILTSLQAFSSETSSSTIMVDATSSSQALTSSESSSPITSTPSVITSGAGSIPTSIGSGFRVIVTASISNSRVIPFRNGTIARKRQDVTLYLVADGDGTFSTTGTECQSTTFELSVDGRLLQDTSRIFASAADIIAGSGPFQSIPIGSTAAGQDDGLSVVGTNVQWSNAEFGNANAIFALDPVSNSVQVYYSGSPPIDTVIQLSILASDSKSVSVWIKKRINYCIDCVSSSQSGNIGPSSVGISSEIVLGSLSPPESTRTTATSPTSQSPPTFGSGGDIATQTNSNLAPFTNPAFTHRLPTAPASLPTTTIDIAIGIEIVINVEISTTTIVLADVTSEFQRAPRSLNQFLIIIRSNFKLYFHV